MNSFYNNYKFVREDSEKEFSFSHLIDTDGFTMDFHSHNFIEVYLSVSGGDHFIIDNKIYEIEPGDLFVSNPNEVHRVIAKENEVYERYVFEFKPTFILPYCTKNTDLLHYVYRREDGFSNKISLNTADHKTFLLLIEKYETLSDTDYGNDVLRELYYLEMLTFVAIIYHTSPQNNPEQLHDNNAMNIIAETLEYISSNLKNDLSLDKISSNIGLSKYHLCKIFKDKTGTTINKYIISRRIAEAKTILASGQSVTDACHESGFKDVSHFVRTFHNVVGVSPGKYSIDTIQGNSYYKGAEISNK